jgi:hypothetical protein
MNYKLVPINPTPTFIPTKTPIPFVGGVVGDTMQSAQKAIQTGIDNWIKGWQESAVKTVQWFGNLVNEILFPCLIIIAIIGVYCNIAGFKEKGNKIILISVMAGIVVKVVSVYVKG